MLKPQEIEKMVKKLPNCPGVYRFLDKKQKILYIGKATSLKNRVRSYFFKNIDLKRSPLIAKMVNEATKVKFQKTNSVLEALILETNLIKKEQPPYNTADKDQKSFNYIIITDEKFPRVLVMRERDIVKLPFAASPKNHVNFLLKISSVRRRRSYRGFSREDGSNNLAISEVFGPFPHGNELKEALKIVRKIFPFRDKCIPFDSPSSTSRRVDRGEVSGCFNYQIGLCPGICRGEITEKEYKKTIKNIVTFFEGKTKKLNLDLNKEMKVLAKKREFEQAEKIKKTIFALKHIQDIAMIRGTNYEIRDKSFRIEAYDVAHIAGKNVVGVMTVLENGELNKKEYRMFKISNQNSKGDTNSLREILERRLKHTDWKMPNLIVVDGGEAQLNTAEKLLKEKNLEIPVVAVTKDAHHKAKEIKSTSYESRIMAEKNKKEILLANNESHRFALNFHRKLRAKSFI